MRKIVAMLLVLALSLGMFGTFSVVLAEEANVIAPLEERGRDVVSVAVTTEGAGEDALESGTDTSVERGITHISTSGILDWDLEFDMLPSEYNDNEASHQGTLETVYYTTDAYDNGTTYEKFCHVYLPYGYDEADTETKYNVFYFQHGNMGSPCEFHLKTNQANVFNLLDNLFDPDHGLTDPCIIVFPTYFMDIEEDVYPTSATGLAGDGRSEIPGNYYREVVEDLIPAVEAKYHTYCEDFSPEGIAASRDHRAWGGFSRGSVVTWYMFHHDIEYFRYFVPMSCECLPIPDPERGATDEEAYAYLKETVDAHPDLPFFLYCTVGGESDSPNMKSQMRYLVAQTDTFSYGLDQSVNNIYYAASELKHVDFYFPYYFYNAAQVLFH